MVVLVTGGAGFIGSHLVDAIAAGGHEVHIIDDLSSGKIENCNPKAAFHQLDIRNRRLAGLVKDIKPAIVCHLAAQVSVSRSIQNPYHDVDVNVLGTINLLEACVQNSVKRVVFSSSAAVYGMPQVSPIAENQILNPISPYGASKASAEKYLQLFGDIYGLEYAILRYSNVYGPRQDSEGEGGVVSVFHDRIQQNLPLYIYGSGEQTRDFIYVQDVVTANITALSCPANIICNVSTECRTSINKLAKLMAGDKPLEIQYRPARSGDIMHSVLCNKQFKTITGLTPVFSIEQGLEDMRRSLGLQHEYAAGHEALIGSALTRCSKNS